MYKVTIIDKSTLSERQPHVKHTINFSKSQNKSNIIFETSDDNIKEESNFKKVLISPKVIRIKDDGENSILEKSQLDDDGGMILIDFKSPNDVNIDCISSTWQPESTKIDKFIFHDLDTETTTINNIVIEGSLEHIIGIDDIIKSQDIEQIDKLIGIFKENNENLLNKLLKDDNK
ncbi:hypothetical protein C6P40_003092 [Pichia californica]|uniref:Uncharacterized protein n=1 Tax=Pichia californica TaxID=460514 RepID=A0A9P7BI55_9ASCO|nr:hypothetical protein C6P42_001725 [[Candida] californica]KAG0690378.1 hypothetical protein C6P40_003092 [[Candida] californica]